MKKKYEKPKVEVIRLEADDVIRTSGCSGCPNETEEMEF